MLRIRCLGQLAVVRDDQPLAGAASQPRRMAILAILARAGDRGVTREKLIRYLWPDSDEERARRLVSQAVYMLRRDLGSEDAIVGVRDLRLGAEHVTSDVAEFQEAFGERAYERAAALYAGDFLDGFHVPAAAEFERWADEERRALAHDAAIALERCAEGAEARGDHPSAVDWWRRRAARDPLDARVAVRLMRSLAAAGDRAGAIRHAAIHETLVREELALPADAEVLAFAERLRAEAEAPKPPRQRADIPASAGNPASISSPSPIAVPASIEATVASPAAAAAAEPRVDRADRRWRRVAIGAGLASLIVVGGTFQFLRAGTRARVPLALSRVVVAPLENRTGDPALDALGAMAAEWVTQGLSRTGLVQVVDARTMLETARDAGPAGDPRYLRTIAERTGAGTVVSGSYFLEGDRIRFLTRISEAPSGNVRHAIDMIDAPASTPTSALDPVRQRVVGALAVLLDQRLNNWTAATSQPPTYEAYAEFLLGMQTFGADYENSVHHFLRAAQLDSSYRQALLWAAMAKANMRRYREADSLFRTIDGVRGTLAPYDEANFDYFYGGFVRGDWERAYDGARRMVDLAPGAGHALYAAGLTAQITNRPQEAIDHLTRIDTRDGWGKSWSARVHNLLARASHQLGDYAAELERAMRLRDAEPNVGWTRLAEVKALAALGRGGEAVRRAVEGAAFPPTTSTWEDYSPGDFLWQSGRELAAHGYASETRALFERAERWFATRAGADRETVENRRGHARVLYALGRWEEARSLYASVLADDPGTAEHRGAMGVIAARLGRAREADSIAALLAVDDRPYQFGAPSLWAGRIAAVRGDREVAIAMLHQALREGHSRRYTWHADPDFASLRDFPAFRELLQPRVPNGR